ncbi:MAG: large subunit ribosomal protein [Solirubrobacteraceae bacterium]|jgi:large subunit ribosomal protein L29|nr:large subunit ribosomal protein [Solirubrobacteraceae bacterium]
MKAGQVHDLADDQLIEFVGKARQEVFNLRFQHATGQLENTARLNTAKRDLARGLTVASQRGIDVDRELARQETANA